MVVLVAAHFNKQSLDLQNHHECHLLHPCRKGAADTRTPKGCTQSSSPGSAFPELSAASQIGFPTSKQSLLTQRQGKQQHHPTLHEQFPSRLLTAQQRCEAELGWHSSSCHGCSADISSDCSSCYSMEGMGGRRGGLSLRLPSAVWGCGWGWHSCRSIAVTVQLQQQGAARRWLRQQQRSPWLRLPREPSPWLLVGSSVTFLWLSVSAGRLGLQPCAAVAQGAVFLHGSAAQNLHPPGGLCVCEGSPWMGSSEKGLPVLL